MPAKPSWTSVSLHQDIARRLNPDYEILTQDQGLLDAISALSNGHVKKVIVSQAGVTLTLFPDGTYQMMTDKLFIKGESEDCSLNVVEA